MLGEAPQCSDGGGSVPASVTRGWRTGKHGAAIVRVNPETGASAALLIPQYFGGAAGSDAFDSYRLGMLANVDLPPV